MAPHVRFRGVYDSELKGLDVWFRRDSIEQPKSGRSRERVAGRTAVLISYPENWVWVIKIGSVRRINRVQDFWRFCCRCGFSRSGTVYCDPTTASTVSWAAFRRRDHTAVRSMVFTIF